MLVKRSEDPQIPEGAFEMIVDHQEFIKAKKKADQDQSHTTLEQCDILNKQRHLLTKSLGRSKVDTGFYDTMYDRLLRAK